MSDLTVKVSRTVRAPIESVFNAWLNPQMLAQFMIPAEGMQVPRAEADPQIGGRFEIVMQNGNRELPHGGQYLKITPHSQIVFTWESPFSAEGSTVTVNLMAVDEGTLIELTHLKLKDEESRDSHHAGWEHILLVLSEAIEEIAA